VTARGNAKQAIVVDDQDRHRFVDLLAKEVEQQRWLLYAWCQALHDRAPDAWLVTVGGAE